MKVKYIDDSTPRSDGRSGKPTQVTLHNEYTVAEILETQYAIINDFGKLCRYSKSRFVITDYTAVVEISTAYNALTHSMRMELNALRKLNLNPEVKINKEKKKYTTEFVVNYPGNQKDGTRPFDTEDEAIEWIKDEGYFGVAILYERRRINYELL